MTQKKLRIPDLGPESWIFQRYKDCVWIKCYLDRVFLNNTR